MESQPFAALAQIRVLLLPVGTIRKATFDSWANEIRTFEEIRLGDIPSDSRDDRARFMPNAASSGHLHLSYISHPPTPSHDPLLLFRPSHFPLAVVGIAESSNPDTVSEILTHFNASLLGKFPPEFHLPLARNCLVFEAPNSETQLSVSHALPGLVVIPSSMGNKRLYIGTLLAELCSNVLSGFADIVRRLETPWGNDILNMNVFPSLPLSPEPPHSPNGDAHGSSASQHSEPDLSLNGFANRTKSPNSFLKRTSTMGPGASSSSTNLNRASTLGVPPPKKRQSTFGNQPSHGRFFKVLGDFFLLAARIGDAVIWYNEAIAMFRAPQDSLWHAAALEGIATASVVDAYSKGHGLSGSHSSTQEWADVADKLNQAVSMYFKQSAPTDAKDQYPLMTYLYTTAVLRHSSLLFSVWSAKGWGPLAFSLMLHPQPDLSPAVIAIGNNTPVLIDRVSSITGLYRSDIASVLMQAHGPWLMHLGPRDRLEILKFLATMSYCLGFKRKESLFLREIVMCIMELLTSGREQARLSASMSSVGLGIKEIEPNANKDHIAVRQEENTAGNDSILALVEQICSVHRVDLRMVEFADMTKSHNAPAISILDENLKEAARAQMLRRYGWNDLQLVMLNEALMVAEVLPNYPQLILYALSALKSMNSILEADDQYHCYVVSARAFATIRRRNDDRKVEHWSGNPLIDIEVAPLSSARVPMERPISQLHSRLSGTVSSLQRGPFFYNPRQITASDATVFVLQDEDMEFVVTLRNTLAVALELDQVCLSTTGVAFQTRPVAVVIPPKTIHRLCLSGKASETGTLIVRGCWIQGQGSVRREFVIPRLDQFDEEKMSRKKGELLLQGEKLKSLGLSGPVQSAENQETASSQFMELKVIPPLPLLLFRRASSTYGAVMLYEGETQYIQVDMDNVSTLPVDFLEPIFEDTTKLVIEQALAEEDLSASEKYEMEYSLLNRPVLSWDTEGRNMEIPPGTEGSVTLACYGKATCTKATAQFIYSCTQRSEASEAQKDVFYTRQLTIPISVTVYQVFECDEMDIIALRQMDNLTMQHVLASSAQALVLMSGLQEYGWSLFCIDVRNVYSLPFDVAFSYGEDESTMISISKTVPPGSTIRFLLPFKRFTLPEEKVSLPIPSLLDRQFVVAQSNLSLEEDKSQRELFWYREELFKQIRARWTDSSGSRTGDLSLRSQRLTLHMLKALRSEGVFVKMQVVSDDTSSQLQTKQGVITPNQFVRIQTDVTNLSVSPVILTISYSIEPAEYVIYDGVLSRVPVGRVESGASQSIYLDLCFLAEGRFELTAIAHVVGATGTNVGNTELRLLVRDAYDSRTS